MGQTKLRETGYTDQVGLDLATSFFGTSSNGA